jgi:hypothetical protein
MSLTIQSGPATVVANGMATCFFGHPLTFVLSIDGAALEVVLFFVTDEGDASCRVSSAEVSGGWHFRLINFDESHGKGSSEPVLLGEREDTLLFFHFRTFRYGQTRDRSVHYTFFTMEKADAAGEAG